MTFRPGVFGQRDHNKLFPKLQGLSTNFKFGGPKTNFPISLMKDKQPSLKGDTFCME